MRLHTRTTIPEEVLERMPHRIVLTLTPSKHHAAIAAAPAQQLEYHGGPLLTSIQIKAVFWGDAWHNDTSAVAMKPQIEKFLQWIVTSALVDQMAEYSTATQQIVRGAYQGSALIPGTVAATVTDADVQNQLTNFWKSQPNLGASALWPVFLPPNVQISAFNQRSCVDFCGYHEAVSNTAYAVVPFPDCSSCIGNMQPFDSLTTVVSHEVCEAITDPFANGWYAPNGYEIGDLCAVPTWQTKTLNGYTVQKEWSNKNSGCV
ncbi:MAG: hypothetical protein JO233_04250 [Candidatus Eremiobacteraeota bacterium]|nr:hypothetical protein [Candidatus Eremiobacteraeota bacterium]